MAATDSQHRGEAHCDGLVQGPIIVFDGQCVLCNGSVRFVLKHDRNGRYRFAASQGAGGSALLVANGLDPDDPASFLLLQPDGAWTNSDAVIRVLQGFGGPWKACALLRWLPRRVRDKIYRVVARNRKRWFGAQACMVPTPAQRARFID